MGIHVFGLNSIARLPIRIGRNGLGGRQFGKSLEKRRLIQEQSSNPGTTTGTGRERKGSARRQVESSRRQDTERGKAPSHERHAPFCVFPIAPAQERGHSCPRNGSVDIPVRDVPWRVGKPALQNWSVDIPVREVAAG